ncbi:hypothetical protein DRQ25_12410 [Candidatus Fermentibacteria bacterium]|nr:MAG: hypothetical protein DRQ25_12410 [Candidatus Fermentibacteria bacterium]
MRNPPTDKQLSKIPKVYSTDGIKLKDKKCYMKFFVTNWRWYILEYNAKDREFFALAVTPYVPDGELGYVSYDELRDMKIRGYIEVERDFSINSSKPVLLSTALKNDNLTEAYEKVIR